MSLNTKHSLPSRDRVKHNKRLRSSSHTELDSILQFAKPII